MQFTKVRQAIMWQNIKDLEMRVHTGAINYQGVRDDNRDEKK